MKKMTIFIIIVMTMSVLLAAPSWYTNPGRLYDPSVNWVGAGQGTSFDAATNAARTQLIGNINQSITGSTNVPYISTNPDGRAYYVQQITTRIRPTIEQHIGRAETTDRAQERNQFYVLLSLNRDGFLASLEPHLRKLLADMQEVRQVGDREFKTNGQIVSALDKYGELQRLMTDFVVGRFIFDNISRNPFNANDLITVSDIESMVRELVNTIGLEVISGDNQIVRAGSAFPEPIVWGAFATSDGVKIPIANLPVKMTFADVVEERMTNNDGQFPYQPITPANITSDGKIILTLDLSQFPMYYAELFKNIKAEATYRIAAVTREVVAEPVVQPPLVTPPVAEMREVKEAGEYRIGDIGPAGGLIFYDKGTYSNGWRYMEAAPEDNEHRLLFWVAPFDNYNYNEILETTKSREVGNGLRHTQILTNMWNSNGGGFNTAIRYVVDLNINGYTDWFLPTIDELNWMYGNLHSKDLGGFKMDWYWTSTTNIYNSAYARNFASNQEEQYRGNRQCYVRAARRF